MTLPLVTPVTVFLKIQQVAFGHAVRVAKHGDRGFRFLSGESRHKYGYLFRVVSQDLPSLAAALNRHPSRDRRLDLEHVPDTIKAESVSLS
jgi:hypothetical protein